MIHVLTFEFLKDLAENNNREWFHENKSRYEHARANVINFASEVIREVSGFDALVPIDTNAGNSVFRIYRDTRFSKDKTPYKTHFGIGISPLGKNFKGPGYYIHLQPGNSFISAGSWMPEPALLKAIRQEIDYNGPEFHSILSAPDFVRLFGDLDREDFLKTTPKGYEANHPDIFHLKLKSFTASHDIENNNIVTGNFVKYTSDVLRTLVPFVEFLRRAVS